jgi:membrane protease subunit (stomatin/prohibitin family)
LHSVGWSIVSPVIEFGGPVDNLTDGPTGLVVTLRVFGELAFRVTEPAVLLAKLIGTGAEGDFNTEISTWVKDQTLAAIRAVLPDIVATHGVLAMGQLQDATSQAALTKANSTLSTYGLTVTAFGELNVNLPDADAHELKQFAATKAYSGIAGSFDSAVRGQAALQIADGIADGRANAQQGIVAGMMMGVPVAPGAPAAAVAAPAAVQPAVAAPAAAVASVPSAQAGETAAHFCAQCGTALAPGAHFCPNCGAAITTPES